MEENLIYTVRKIFQQYKFYIPSYQRGYKWSRENVVVLLDDLLKFQESGKESYCLQNITIVEGNKGRVNVVDGQQRLTTIYIILSYLKSINALPNDFSFSPNILIYGVRTSTAEFLSKEVATGNIWLSEINADNSKHKDEYYILEVCDAIKKWFSSPQNNSKEVKKIIDASTILDRVVIITNKITSGSEEQLFSGINGSKVDLDGADLVRAELITRSAQERFGFDSNNKESFKDRINEFRVRIGMELDEINKWWSIPEHKLFFGQMLRDKTADYKSHIFNYNEYPIDLLYLLYYECDYNTDEKIDFRFFEYGRDTNNIMFDHDHWELYESLIKLHHTMVDWYNDQNLYHWLGYLFYCYKGQSTDLGVVSFREIYRKWGQWEKWSTNLTNEERNNQIKSRSEFITYLRNLSKSLLLKPYINKDESSSPKLELMESISNLENDWYNGEQSRLQNILVLMDVLLCTDCYEYSQDDNNKGKKRLVNYKLHPLYFHMHNENKEHIRSCTPNDAEGKNITNKNEWEKHINDLYGKEKEGTEEYKLKELLLNTIRQEPSDTLSEGKIKEINAILNKHAQNSIGNLLLLNEHVNKSYGNDPFNKKVQRIIREYMQQKNYIRPFTLLVFLSKIKGDDAIWRWTKQDINNNALNIKKQVEIFLKTK